MKHFIMILAIILFTGIGTRAQQKSDAEIKQDFESKYRSLLASIESAATMDDIEKIDQQVSSLEREFKPYKSMLDQALYPDDFAKNFEKLRGQVAYAKEKISTIQNQGSRIAELEQQVKTLTEQVEKLSNENTALLGQVQTLNAQMKELKDRQQTDQRKIDSLTMVVGKLRSNLAQRDKMIFALVDSLFLQYDKLPPSAKDVGKQKVAAFERSNVLTNIKRSILDNAQFLVSTNLKGEDIAKLMAEHQRFASQWKGLGPRLADVYLGEREKVKEVALIDTMLVEWKKQINQAFWKSLNNVFTQQKLAVQPFASGEEFYKNVVQFIDSESSSIETKEEGIRYKTYELFAETVWEKEITPTWLPVLKEGGMITDNQIADIKARLDVWRSKVKPPRTVLYISIAAIVLLICLYLYSRMKKKPTVQPK